MSKYIPERPPTVEYRNTKVKYSDYSLIINGVCLIAGIIFGLLIGRFV